MEFSKVLQSMKMERKVIAPQTLPTDASVIDWIKA
jgi:hypothetical protein